MKSIYLAGGCFWCIEYFYRMAKGVISVTSGYSGGEEINPTYEDVKNQKTKHRETIKIDFDETQTSIEQLVNIYFAHIDPLDKDGQFGDIGHSYTLAMYYQNKNEKLIFTKLVNDLQNKIGKQVYISIEPFKSFYKAEEYHQNYACKNPKAFHQELVDSGRKK